jgi:hydrogen peroxide-dependent heme synthase
MSALKTGGSESPKITGMAKQKNIEATDADIPAAPMALEGSAILHQMFRVRWPALRSLEPARREAVVAEASQMLESMARSEAGESAMFAMLGHKADLMLVHFRRGFDQLAAAQLRLSNLGLNEFLEPTTSYLSAVELGLYQRSVGFYRELRDKGIKAHSEEWNRAVEDELAHQRQKMANRLWPKIPETRYVCFYPMSKRRGEEKNWYALAIEERRRLMHDHGLVGRRYAGQVTQIISASTGLDDWEWGVDLFADDAVVFKRLVYEMRFDEASAAYALFGAFYVGLRLAENRLGDFLAGKIPAVATFRERLF